MRRMTWQRVMVAAGLIISLMGAGFAQGTTPTTPDLTPFLQAEINEIAVLTAQMNLLQQQGDVLGASVVASYIPDHRMMVDRISTIMRARGGDPTRVQAVMPTMTDTTRLAILNADITAHQQVMASYRTLADSTQDLIIQQLARMGQSGATTHLNSLVVAKGATTGTPGDLTQGLIASLALERTAIADLQLQANRLVTLGDQVAANTLQGMIPSHQQQATVLEGLIRQMGGDPAQAIPAPIVALDTRDAILQHVKVADAQFVNTYALPIAALPESPIRRAFQQGQQYALISWTQLQGIPTTTITT